jgi:hypothetical protein
MNKGVLLAWKLCREGGVVKGVVVIASSVSSRVYRKKRGKKQ